MEVLQPILNIVAITGVTSLSLICILQKRELDQLRKSPQKDLNEPFTEILSTIDQGRSLLRASTDEAETAEPVVEAKDIRLFVAERADKWAALSIPRATSPGQRIGLFALARHVVSKHG